MTTIALTDRITVKQPESQALSGALRAYHQELKQDQSINSNYLAIIDFNQPSYKQRFFVYNIHQHRAIYSALVAQGRGSGVGAYARHFSNAFGTDMSSIGAFLTTGNYPSEHGESIHIEGLDPGVNSNAAQRTLEIHSAWYVTPAFAAKYHRVGNSLGCFALSPKTLKAVRPEISDDTVLYAFYSPKQHTA